MAETNNRELGHLAPLAAFSIMENTLESGSGTKLRAVGTLVQDGAADSPNLNPNG